MWGTVRTARICSRTGSAGDQTGSSGGERGRAVITLTQGGVTDLRSVPEPSLADSIFSLEDENVQELGERDVCDSMRRGGGGGVHACLTGCLPQVPCSGLAAADQLGLLSASPWPPFAPCRHRKTEIDFLSRFTHNNNNNLGTCCNNDFTDRKFMCLFLRSGRDKCRTVYFACYLVSVSFPSRGEPNPPAPPPSPPAPAIRQSCSAVRPIPGP